MSETDRYKCPSCGGTMEFNAKSQNLKCPFCDTEMALDEYQNMADQKAANNVDIKAGAQRLEDPEAEVGAAAKYVCNSCGGEITPSFTSASTKCPFCDAPIVLTDKIKDQMVPDLMIPFKLDKKDVKNTYINFVNKCHFVPSDFKSSAHVDSIKPTYVPFWLYSCKTDAELTISGEIVTRSRAGNVEKIKHDVYELYRHVQMDFENVPADGSKDMDDALMDSLEPFNLDEAQNYNSAYLSGYGALLYDVGAEDNTGRVRKRMENSVVDTVFSTLRDYEHKEVKQARYTYSNNVIKYALFPVWIQETSWNNKSYVFAMNGQTGKFVGSVPVDYTKVGISWGLFTILLTAIGGGVYHFILNEAQTSALSDFSIAFIACAVICGIVHAIIVSGNNNVAEQTIAQGYAGELEPQESSDAFVRTFTETRTTK